MKKFSSLLILAAAGVISALVLLNRPPVNDSREKSKAIVLAKAVAPDAPLPPPKPSRHELALKYMQLIKPLLDSSNQTDHDLIYTNLLRGLVAADPAMAGWLAESLAPGDVRAEFVRRVAQAWAAVDPDGATTWAAGLTDSGEQKATLTGVAFQIAQTDPAAAVALAEKSDLGNTGALANLAQQWACKDLAATLEWATQQPAGVQRDQIIAQIAFVQAHTAPVAAVDLIVGQIPPGPAQDEAAISVLQVWGMQDYKAASDWVNQFPETPLRNRALNELSGMQDRMLGNAGCLGH